MSKLVFSYGPEMVIATSRAHAKRILRAELGEAKESILKRAKPPFLLADSDNEPLEVDEAEFCERVSTYGEGMVLRD